MADESGLSIALTSVQLYAVLNGKDISQAELASNTWHEMPLPPSLEIDRFLGTLPEPNARNDAWSRQTHYSQPNPPDCWTPPRARPLDEQTVNRDVAVLEIIGGAVEMAGGHYFSWRPSPPC